MKAMILAAGFGTRLRPLTEELPKPLVPVLGRPLIEHTLRFLKGWGIEEVVINLHHLPEAIPAALGDGGSLELGLSYIVEEGEIKGTGGGIRGAADLLDDGSTFLVVNGDVLFEPDLDAALALHRKLGAISTMVLREDPRAGAFGSVEVDPGGRVRRLLGRPEWQGANLSTNMFTGLHLLEPEVFDLLPETGCIVREFYLPTIEKGERVVGGHVDGGTWVELGTLSDYLAVNLALATGDLQLGHLVDEAEHGLWLSPDAELKSGAELRAPVIVGARARVSSLVERAVIWPDAEVSEPVRDAVVTPRGVFSNDLKS